MLISQAFSWNKSSSYDTLDGSVMYHYDKHSNVFYGL